MTSRVTITADDSNHKMIKVDIQDQHGASVGIPVELKPGNSYDVYVHSTAQIHVTEAGDVVSDDAVDSVDAPDAADTGVVALDLGNAGEG